jgi:hypothetical protein
MTRRDVGMLCIFTTQTALRENAQRYRFWGLLGSCLAAEEKHQEHQECRDGFEPGQLAPGLDIGGSQVGMGASQKMPNRESTENTAR